MRLWPRQSEPEPVYYPETQYLGPIDEGEWKSLLPELAKAYDSNACKPLFRAMQVMLRRNEREMAGGPKPPITEASLLEWTEEQKRRCHQADLLRFLVRLPLHAQKQLRLADKREKERESEQERETKR